MSDMPNMQPPDSPTANPSQTRATDEQRRRVLDHIADLKHAGRRREAQAFAAVLADSATLTSPQTLGSAVNALVAEIERGVDAAEDARIVINGLIRWQREKYPRNREEK